MEKDEKRLLWELVNHPGWAIAIRQWKLELADVTARAMDPRASHQETDFNKGAYSMLDSIIHKAEEMQHEVTDGVR